MVDLMMKWVESVNDQGEKCGDYSGRWRRMGSDLA